MAREWIAECKDCGEEYGYSHTSHVAGMRRGMSRPERCPDCRRLHSREISTLGLSHFDLTPIKPIPASGLRPGNLGGLSRPERVHKKREEESKVDFAAKFGIQDEHIREYFARMEKYQVTVVVAPTGAGKSTFLPYRFMVPPEPFPPDLWTRNGQIIITQPRIQATRGIPAYVSSALNGSSLGAGFDIGFRHSGSPATDWRNKMVYLTDGTLINMIVRNELGRLSVIMIDEAHERSVNIDLILGLLKLQLPRYPHLRLVIASATINTNLFADYFGVPHEAIYEFPGKRKFPVEARFNTDNSIPSKLFNSRMPDMVAEKAFDILLAMETGENAELITMTNDGAPKGPIRGDILAFLQGQKPIETAVAALQERVEQEPKISGKVDVLPLFTRLPQADQTRALQAKTDKARWRVVISTNVAETSLTVEGIVHVIETGLINESRWDPRTQTGYVEPTLHSQAGCQQRWGRAGRVQPGIAHCLYTEEQFRAFPKHTDPEIVRAPIDQIVLTAKSAGVDDVVNFPWIERPRDDELTRAPHYLRRIGALDADGDLTEHGLELRQFPEEIDIANLMILADRFACTVEMATLIPMIKLGGCRTLLQWDHSWDAPTKRAVHQLHRGLMAPCQDDVEFYLKLWASWEGAVKHPFEEASSSKGVSPEEQATVASGRLWAERHFVDHSLLEAIRDQRDSLIHSLSGHKKDDEVRPIEFALLTRLRMVLTYGLNHQIYELTNAEQLISNPGTEPEYQPFLPDTDVSPAVKALHEGATVEIGPESVCFGKGMESFVCGKRQRVRHLKSPQEEPETKIVATFLSLIHPEWLKVIDQSPIVVAKMIAAETRDANGALIPTSTLSRLFIDQAYPIGAQFVCRPAERDGLILIGDLHQAPPPLIASNSYEEQFVAEGSEVLDKETELQSGAGIDNDAKRTVVIRGEDDDNPWLEIVDSEDEEGPYVEYGAASAIREKEPFLGKIYAVEPRDMSSAGEEFVATVVGYDFSNRQMPRVQLAPIVEPEPFEEFARHYEVGQDIEVEIVQVEKYLNDWQQYLIVREPKTRLEMVLDPYDVNIGGQNFAIECLKNHIGETLSVTIDAILEDKRQARVSRLKYSEAAMLEFMGTSSERVVDAAIMGIRDIGLYVRLDPANTDDLAPCGAFVHVNNLPNRPGEMVLGQGCQVRVELHNWRKRPLRKAIPLFSDEIGEALTGHLTNTVSWDDNAHEPTLLVTGRISYHDRGKLMEHNEDGEYRRVVNWLYRRSNEFNAKIIDVSGLDELASYHKDQLPAKVEIVRINRHGAEVETEGGHRAWVPKHQLTYDPLDKLEGQYKLGERVELAVESVDMARGEAILSKLDPSKDPLREYRDGQRAFGIVKGFMKDGSAAFVGLRPGIDGYLHKEETDREGVADAREALEEGDIVEVCIQSIDVSRRQLRLTMRWLHQMNIFVPPTHKGLVIGENGDTIAEIQKKTRTQIDIGEDGNTVVKGRAIQDVEAAHGRIMAILKASRVARLFLDDGRQIGMLIGTGGQTITELRSATGSRIEVDDLQVTITATGQDLLERTIDAIRDQVTLFEDVIAVSPEKVGRIIGSGGNVIKELVKVSGARIDVSDDGSGRITINSKNQAAILRAREAIKEITGDITSRSSTQLSIGPYELVPMERETEVTERKEGSESTPVAFLREYFGSSSKQKQVTTALDPMTSKQTRPGADTLASFFSLGKTVVPSGHRGEQPASKQTTLHESTLSLTTAQIVQLQMPQHGGSLARYFGGEKPALQRIQEQTGVRITVNMVTDVLTIRAHSAKAVERAKEIITEYTS